MYQSVSLCVPAEYFPIMTSLEHALEGVYDHKMDPKSRVSIPADWRVAAGSGELRLLQSSSYGLPVLRVLTQAEYVNMLQEVESRVEWTPAQKKQMKGKLHSRCLKTSLNPQGKLLMPKAWCENPSLEQESKVVLVGRGTYFEVFNPTNYSEMCTREDAETEVLNAELDFF